MAAHATTIVLPTDEQLIAKSPLIVDGTVLSTNVVDRDGTLWTDTIVEVSRTIKGTAESTITIREMGGVLGDRITKLFGTPEFKAGEQVLLFLEPNPRGGYRTMDLYVGKFTAGEMRNGQRLWMRDDVSGDVSLLDANFQSLHAKNVQRDAVTFEAFVRERVAGRAGVKNYGIENPILTRDAVAERGVSSDFTLIDEPTVYRWFRFASGQAATWYSLGTQTGYTDGGVSELRTAMGAWTGYASASINYSYGGSRTGAMGGLDGPNGVNEVLFNDPLDEIAGTYNRNTGGVVGRGGFNGVSSRQTFTATFTADAAHQAGAVQAWNITEGNLTIQNGVAPTNGVSSKVLAEIVAHEFGHTLGFGHSEDSSALMYATVTGLGPTLRTDDQTAARWLYPNGTGTTPPPPPPPAPPAAPSSLTAQVSGNNIDLSWVDNASNETGHWIYLAVNNGAYSKVAETGANVRTARLSGLGSGSYRIYVAAYNAAGSAQSNTATATIAAAPVAKFTLTPQTGIAGVTTFTFYDESTGSVASRVWNFGDGGSSGALVTTHMYATPGQYTVTLTVSGAGGSSSVSKVILVSASTPVTPPVNAAFNVSTQSPQTAQNVTFTDASTGAPTAWSWSFGDGATTNVRNPVHAYAGPGTYTVTLTASNAVSSASASKQITVSSLVPYRALVSVATYVGGIGGTSWRTELNLFNAGTQGANVSLVFIPTAGGSVVSRSVFLSPRQALTYANALVDLFGISYGAGALGIEATSAGASADLRVSSRTFTTGVTGTYGQAVPDVQPEGLEKTLYITGIAANASFRTNIGVVNRGAAAVNATLTLYSRTGATLSTKTLSIPASSFQQAPLSSFFPEVAGTSQDVLTMRIVAAASDAISAYASVVDNLTQDPIYIQARPAETGGSLTIPVVGRTSGANGTFWRSDVTIFNTSPNAITLTLRYNGAVKSVFIGGSDTAVVDDVMSEFGLTSSNGALKVEWSSSTGPVVTSRTYTSVATGGTYGQSIDPVAGFASRVFVPGLRNDGSYRSNIGFVNGGSETEFFNVILLSPSGTELARKGVTLTAGQQMQTSVGALFPNVTLPAGFTMQAEGDGNAKLFAYGSMVDNVSGDPVFYAGR
ncbi:MAG: PKD domain-containing protein [Thermoanaerobaculia bacterium]